MTTMMMVMPMTFNDSYDDDDDVYDYDDYVFYTLMKPDQLL